MSLIARMAGIPENGQPPEEVKKLGFWQVLAFVSEVEKGHIAASVAYTELDLSASEQNEFNNYVTALANRGTVANKRAWISELGLIFNMAELGVNGSPGTNYTDLQSITARIQAI